MVVSNKTFDAKGYWEQRLQEYPGIKGVGYLGRSARFLEQQYTARKHQVELALRRYGLADEAGRAILDIGSGTGIWLDFWHRHGAGRMVGLDFTQTSVNRLRECFPDDLIVQADVSETPLPLPASTRFDIISAFDVLLHIVDPDAFRRVIANLASYCAAGGWLIISDAIVHGQGYVPKCAYAVHNKVRSIAEYRDELTAHGFVIDSVQPATVLLDSPLEASNHLTFQALRAWWKATGLWGRSNLLSALLGPGAIKADRMACRLCAGNSAPSSKIIFARKLPGGVKGEGGAGR